MCIVTKSLKEAVADPTWELSQQQQRHDTTDILDNMVHGCSQKLKQYIACVDMYEVYSNDK